MDFGLTIGQKWPGMARNRISDSIPIPIPFVTHFLFFLQAFLSLSQLLLLWGIFSIVCHRTVCILFKVSTICLQIPPNCWTATQKSLLSALCILLSSEPKILCLVKSLFKNNVSNESLNFESDLDKREFRNVFVPDKYKM